MRELEPARGSRELRVERPQFRAREGRGRQEVRVDPADAGPHQAMVLDEREDFVVGRGHDRRELAQQPQHFPPLGEIAARQLAHDQWMRTDVADLE